ncbi:hypothetical protein BGZ83_008772 [Gryganskiella cystojenkinii]|nr:hypothetical protein BGZ83_008772 [Gryganskiella cystojenkinii]
MKESLPRPRPGRGLQSRTLAGMVIIIVVSGWILLSNVDLLEYQLNRLSTSSSTSSSTFSSPSPNDHSEDKQESGNYQQQQQQQPPTTASDNNNKQSSTKPPRLESVLEPAVPYLTYLPFAGLSNQFIGLESAAFVAKQLNRTLIIPPIISNTHDHYNTHQSWSHFLDLARFTNLTGVRVLEWDQVRPLTQLQRLVGQEQSLYGFSNERKQTERWQQFAENLTCVIVNGYGAPDQTINISAQTFVWHFLLNPIFERPVPPKSGSKVYDRTKTGTNNWHLEDVVVMDDLVERYRDWEGPAAGGPNLLTLTNAFKLRDPGHVNRLWLEIGQHIHFLPKIMEYATMKTNEVLESDEGSEVLDNHDPEEVETQSSRMAEKEIEKGKEGEPSPDFASENYSKIEAPRTRIPYIAIHLRRGDIGLKCPKHDQTSCLIPLERYAEAVERARTLAANELGYGEDLTKTGKQHHLPVVVTTDSTDEDDFAKIREYGWHRLDHNQYNTQALFGSFGPALIDAAILAHADVFVGSQASTMTKLASMRQQQWYHRDTLYPIIPTNRKLSLKRLEEQQQELQLVVRGGQILSPGGSTVNSLP